MATIEVDEETNGLLAFASVMTGLSPGELVARLVQAAGAHLAAPTVGAPTTVPIYATYLGHRTEAVYDRATRRITITDGKLATREFDSPSPAARAVVAATKDGVSTHRNGWGFWRLAGSGRPLQTIRYT
jgi:hypothetical protein